MRRLKFVPRNKKGIEGILFFVIALLVILMIGFIGSIVAGVINLAGDEIVPVFQEIGTVGDVNISQAAEYSIEPANTFAQSLTWLVGFAYVVMIILSMVFVITYETNPHPAFMGAYFFFVVLIVFGSFIISNAYEDIYTGTDDLATRMQEQTLLSYMILYSPGFLILIAFITGIFLFSRVSGGGM